MYDCFYFTVVIYMNYNPKVDILTLFNNPGFDRGMDSVWYYEDHQNNNAIVERFTEGLISEDMIDAFTKSYIDNFYPDDFTWLYNLYRRAGTPYHNLQVILKDKILENYNYIRGYHGTRVLNQESFLAQGINSFEPNTLNEQARNIFLIICQTFLKRIFSMQYPQHPRIEMQGWEVERWG